MKFLLAAVNAKYIHSNLGIYSLRAYAREKVPGCEISLGEYTINHHPDEVLKDLYRRKPDAVGFSCYIWNIEYIRRLIRDLPKILPDTDIWLGGPEVSFCAERILAEEPSVRGVMVGEGEAVFAALLDMYEKQCQKTGLPAGRRTETDPLSRQIFDKLSELLPDSMKHEFSEPDAGLLPDPWQGIPGLAVRGRDGASASVRPAPLMELDRIPFPYEDLKGLENRIVYYESSRGCPFSCSYCLSSIDKPVGYRSLELVKKELDFFLEAGVPQVKFIDRTFNCDRTRAREIWSYIHERDRGITNFHFEISADLLDGADLELMSQMRPGLIQLEIGVQSVNPVTIREIHRTMDVEKLFWACSRIRSFGNIRQHLDLIAGLPYEDLESFALSFDKVYRAGPDQLQLGFLKVLKGSRMEEMAGEYGLLYQSAPPYEALRTRWLSYGDVLTLKAVEEMVEVYYNSGQFCFTMRALEREFASPFGMYEALAGYYEEQGLSGIRHNRLERYEILYRFVKERLTADGEGGGKTGIYRDCLMHDLYLRENIKSRPSFARDLSPWKTWIREFYRREEREPKYLSGYAGRDARQLAHMTHVEAMGDGRLVLYDYQNRNPLSHNAETWVIGRDGGPDQDPGPEENRIDFSPHL